MCVRDIKSRVMKHLIQCIKYPLNISKHPELSHVCIVFKVEIRSVWGVSGVKYVWDVCMAVNQTLIHLDKKKLNLDFNLFLQQSLGFRPPVWQLSEAIRLPY